MSKIGTLCLSLLAVALMVTTPLNAQNSPTVKRVSQAKPATKSEHPHMESAIKALEDAKRQLEEASHSYQGHREKALEHVNAALQECHTALMVVDKK